MRLMVRSLNVKVTPTLQDYISRRLEFALRRFSAHIDRVAINLTDLNGPKGGLDQHCVVKVFLKPSGIVMAEATDITVEAAVNQAIERVVRQIKKSHETRLTLRAHKREDKLIKV